MTIRKGRLNPREPAIDLVRVISEGTYTSFAQALKEFISNAYDADALRVDISIDDESRTLAIKDDGVGMTLADFGESFASIARRGKSAARSRDGRTKLGRLRIGRFGIGALAVIALADHFVVRSSRRGSTEGFEARIDLRELRRHFDRGEDLSDHWAFDYQQWNDEKPDAHFAEVRVEEIREDVREVLQRPGELGLEEFFESVTQLSGTDQLIWQLGMISPVAYEKTAPLPAEAADARKDTIITRRARRLLRDRFEVYVNGRRVRRRITLPCYRPSRTPESGKRSVKRSLLEKRGTGWDVKYFKGSRGGKLTCEGYLVVQAQQLFPYELRGILVRLRGVAIGWHRTLHLAPPRGLTTMLSNMSGEVWVEGLEDALQFDRESFREDHPSFRWLRQIIENAAKEAALEMRYRSAERKEALKRPRPERTRVPPHPVAASASMAPGSGFLLSDVLSETPAYIGRIVPQINGCWERGWFEACAVMTRRLVETLIIHLYHQRGWLDELRDAKTHDFIGLKRMVDKACGDSRIGLDSRSQEHLKRLKDLGDIAAHDFRVAIRKGDLERVRDALRMTSERLLFKSDGTPP